MDLIRHPYPYKHIIPKEYLYPNFLIWSSYSHWCIFFSFFTFYATNRGIFFIFFNLCEHTATVTFRWLSSGKSQHLVVDKAYPLHFVQQEERVTTHTQHVLATGCYQAVSATGEQWLNLYSSDGWDRVIIMLVSYYRLCYIVIIYIVVSHFLFYSTFSLFVWFFLSNCFTKCVLFIP